MTDQTESEMLLVPREVIRDAWVGLVPALTHNLNSCNPGGDVRCFTCTALTALQPYHHGDAGRSKWWAKEPPVDWRTRDPEALEHALRTAQPVDPQPPDVILANYVNAELGDGSTSYMYRVIAAVDNALEFLDALGWKIAHLDGGK